MSRAVEFSIPGRPIPWARAGGNLGADGRGARHFTPHKQRAAMKVVKSAYEAAARGRNCLFTGALKLEILCIYAIPQSWKPRMKLAATRGLVWKTSVPDCDNLGKLVSDALNKVAFTDDAIVAVVTVAKRYGAPERTVIRISELTPWEEALDAIGLPGTQARLPV